MVKEDYDGDKKPLVSVTMLVYNHEKWLAQAIESVMMQQVDFDFDLIIGEDCSTDGSREIVEKYKKLYPNKIIALLNEKNLGMKKNSDNVWAHAHGKYVACCEGDDYWIDSYKLKKQVDFLESHPEYSAIYHSSEIVDASGNLMKSYEGGYVYYEDEDFTWEAAARMELAGQTASCLVRNPMYYADKRLLELNGKIQVLHGDHTGTLLWMSYGKIRKCHEPVSAYRMTYEGSSFTATTLEHDMHYYVYVGALETEKYLNLFSPMHIDNRKLAYSYLVDFFKKIYDGKRGKGKNILTMAKYNPLMFICFLARIAIIYIVSPKVRNAWYIKHLKEINEGIISSGLGYIIFGTGLIGEECLCFFKDMGWLGKIKAVWDNNERKQGRLWHGMTVLAPGQGVNENTLVIIASKRYATEMEKQVSAMNNINGIKLKRFDAWIDDVFDRASTYSWKIRIMNWIFLYERWHMEDGI